MIALALAGLCCTAVVNPNDDLMTEDFQRAADEFAGLYRNKSRAPPGLHKPVIVTLSNWGYREMYRNWACFADKWGLEWMVASVDKQMHDNIGRRSAQLMAESAGDELKGHSAAWDRLLCRKLAVTATLLKNGNDVFFVDVDAVLKRDPIALFEEAVTSDFLFQSNHPGCESKSQHPAGSCMLMNTGLFYASSQKPGVLELFELAYQSCLDNAGIKGIGVSHGGNDQRALQRVLNVALGLDMHWTPGWAVWADPKYDHTYIPKLWKRQYKLPNARISAATPFRTFNWCGKEATSSNSSLDYCVLDPTLYPAGKHTIYDNLIAFHANHKAGGTNSKKRVLNRHGLWGCGVDPYVGK
eukprot:Hpha_TRINITY_DN16798_c1_g3::TRINITY_DN16798_c1_g3_i5::g.77820::m.77820